MGNVGTPLELLNYYSSPQADFSAKLLYPQGIIYANRPVALNNVLRFARPNDATAYAAGDIVGSNVADARIEIPVPIGARGGMQYAIQCEGINTRATADPAFTLSCIFFYKKPVTVLGDNAPIALADDDIQNMLPCSNFPHISISFSTGAGSELTQGAGILGRRRGFGAGSGFIFPEAGPPASLWAYFFTSSAYACLANEEFWLRFGMWSVADASGLTLAGGVRTEQG